MNKKLLWIIIILVVLVVLLIGLKKAGIIGKDEGTKVSAEKVTRRDITEIVTASGKVYPEVEVKISPDVSGEITELNVEEGDSVHRGQVLARIYADIYATQRDQAAGVRVTESRRLRLPRARAPRHAFGFPVAVRGLQCDRQCMRCGGIVGRIRRETPVERNRLVLASECDQ